METPFIVEPPDDTPALVRSGALASGTANGLAALFSDGVTHTSLAPAPTAMLGSKP
jgi:hypothetical protein